MSLELIGDIKGSNRSHGTVDDDLVIFSVKVHSNEKSTFEVLTFRSSKDAVLEEVIDSIDHELENATFWRNETEKWLDDSLTLEEAGIITGTQLELRDHAYSLSLNVVEVRGKVNYKTHPVTIRVSPSTTLEEILIKMQLKNGVHYAISGKLIWKSVLVPDDLTIVSLGLKNNETIHFHPESVNVEVQIPSLDNAKAFKSKAEVYLVQTVKEVKEELIKSLVPKNSRSLPFQILFKGSRLPDKSLFGELMEIEDGSILHLAKVSDAAILIHLQNDSGAYFDLRVKPSMKIEELKKMIQTKKDYPVEHQELRFSHDVLEDESSLFDYGLSSGANLDIYLASYFITVNDVTEGKEIKISVKASNTIRQVKAKLHAVLGVSDWDQTINLDDETPLDSSILCEIGLIHESARLTLSYEQTEELKKKRSDFIRIYVSTLTGKMITISISANAVIDKLKEKIDVTEGIPADQQRLICAGKQLEDGRTLSDYGIINDTRITIVLRLKGCACGCGGRMTVAGGGSWALSLEDPFAPDSIAQAV